MVCLNASDLLKSGFSVSLRSISSSMYLLYDVSLVALPFVLATLLALSHMPRLAMCASLTSEDSMDGRSLARSLYCSRHWASLY